MTAGVIIARSLLVLMEMTLFAPHTKEVYVAAAVTPGRSFKHQKGACWYIDKEDDAVHTTPHEA